MRKQQAFFSIALMAAMVSSLAACGGKTSSPVTSTTSSDPISSSVPVGQTGIGDGLTPDNPVFKGNTGTDELDIYFLEMNYLYGDSILLKKGDFEVLIDAGQPADGPYVKAFLEEKVTDKRIDMLVTTHGHADHIGGMAEALEAVDDASLIVDFGYKKSGEGYTGYRAKRDELQNRGAKYCSSYDSVNGNNTCQSTYYLTDDISVDVIDTGKYIETDKDWSSDPNLTSTTLLFHYKDFTFWTAGDLPTEGERSVMQKGLVPENITMYKAAHHGTNGGNTQDFLNRLNPKLIAISAARAGSYSMDGYEHKPSNPSGVSGHPHAEAIERFYKVPNIAQNLNVYWNMVNGTTKFTTTGENEAPTVQGSPTNRGYFLPNEKGEYVYNEETKQYENKVTGEENLKFHESIVFKTRGYEKYLPTNQQ